MQARLRDRLAARWNGLRLDRALAAGAPPQASPAMALRAQRLASPAERRALSRSLRLLVREAQSGAAPSLVHAPAQRAHVLAARGVLIVLADRLLAPAPVEARGVARVRLLLSDGCGPLFNPTSAEDLEAAADHAIDALTPAAQS